ncbi:chromodomain-helicase-DNA-binding protein 7 isoform X2 [Amblyraja radiata]|uniref:chromodomain-helicase-DNA-binding protein 7 isoform X2 n=1 Tax=Amblyraja radiata TaxID=386614 RepID=UPI001402A7C7|nr:chromodomain-helicase-DNA-binding protein 7 isoform X2 [Amblyraja radiata]
MADPGMLSLFGDDGNIFSEGLEGLGECGFSENPVNALGQQLPMDQGFGSMQSPLHHPPPTQTQTKLTHYDHFGPFEQQKIHLVDQPNRMIGNTPGNGMASPHSQYHNPSVPPVPHSGAQMGVYPAMQNERCGQQFVDSSSMWGPRAVQVPDQTRPAFQQQQQQQPPPQGHAQHMQQMGNYLTRSDYSLQQHNQSQQQRVNQFTQAQEALSQGNPFMGTSGPGHLSRMPQQTPNMGPSLRHTPSQQYHPHPPLPNTLHGDSIAHSPRFSPSPSQQASSRQQNLNFTSRSQAVPSQSVSSSGQYSQYPYSNINQGLVNSNTGINQNLGLNNNPSVNQAIPRYPNTVGFPAGTSQGLMHQQPIHPSGPLNQINAQTMHPTQSQGTYASPSPMSPMKAINNPAGTPPPQVRPGSAGMQLEVGSYPNMPLPQQPHQSPGTMGLGQRSMGPRSMQTPQYMNPSVPRDIGSLPRPVGALGPSGNPADQVMQERIMSGQQHPNQPFQPQLPTCPPVKQHPTVHHQTSPSPHQHQPWAQSQHSSPKAASQQVSAQQLVSNTLADNQSDMTQISGQNSQLASGEERQKSLDQQRMQEKANRIVAEAIAKAKARGEQNIPKVIDQLVISGTAVDSSTEEKKKKKKPKEKKDPKDSKEAKEKKTKSTATAKIKNNKNASNKKNMPESAVGKKKGKRKHESSPENSDMDKTPPPSPQEDDELGVQKRRSSRQVKRKRYTEDLEFKISDDDDAGKDSPLNTSQSEQDMATGPVTEKIMSMRIVKKTTESGEEVEVEELFVKYKNYSYLHCQWTTVEQLAKDKRIHQKIKRFKAKQAQMNKFLTEIEDEPFNPDYVEVDRILDISHSIDKDSGEPVTHYLVKWCSLPYEECTWEQKLETDQGKIEEFQQLQAVPPRTEHMERPLPEFWTKLEHSRDYKNGNQLREYQLEGVNWLLFNWYNSQNCILADEMGLGKTIQSITFLYDMYLKGIYGPSLIIAPLSTITNWEREFRTWTAMNVAVYHGSQASRQMIQAYEMYFRNAEGRIIQGAYKFHAIITTFEMILTDCPELRNIKWRCVIIDEAHRLKNRNCKLLEGLKLMDLEHKVLLTGTPLQNTVEELFSLLNFLEPTRFPSEFTFLQEFGDLKTEEQVQKLQAILKPMMLRRLKEDVEKNLAPKEETIIEVELTNIQKKYYRAILERNFAFLSKGAGQTNVPNLLNTMMELRKCCNHPYLINGAEEKILEEFKETHNPDIPDFQLQAMIQAAGKLVLIDKLLPKLKAGGHKVLIFSQMVRCLDILEDYLIQRRHLYERIDGRVRGNLRQAAIDRFSKPDSDRFVFLLCTRAGGLGINLTAADTCIIFDSDWNPQNDLQAQARCHRIGQSKAVKVYRLITRNSYEREMFDKASLKLGLDKAVLQSMSGRENSANGVQQLSKKEIEDLLRKGAYGALMDEEDEGSKFCEEDIDQILLRRTHTITIESEGKSSTFAKASFVTSGNRTDISLDDPNFWQKWAKKAELDIDAVNGRNTLVIDTPRVRKQTRHYNAIKEDELMEFSDLESESEEKTGKPRRPQDRSHGYPRTECFRVEKNLLVYGWGRWSDILSHGRFKRQLTEHDVETICRTILVYCLNHYRGDEKIKGFIWDLITPTEDGQTRALQNHSGLSAPVPRGRKGKKVKSQSTQPIMKNVDWLVSCNPDTLLHDDGYKKHLKHHCNKVLLRVRMLYYLRQEVIGDVADKIFDGADASDVDIWIPEMDHGELPTDWWDREADKCLLIGVYKHGYEKYNSIRADPVFCFVERVGMPDAKAMAAEQRGTDVLADVSDGVDFDREEEDPEYKPGRIPFKDEMDDFENSPQDDKEECMDTMNTDKQPDQDDESDKLYWPSTSVLTTRLRRLITAYQRSYKREQMKLEALSRSDRRRRRPRDEVKAREAERNAAISEKRQRWTRREEADFYRVVSTFGIVFDPVKKQFDWNQFRAFARLDKKSDDSLEKYFNSFVAMCKKVCHMPPNPDEEADSTIFIEPITEERASRTLYRIELLRKVREQVLLHAQLVERLKLCQPSMDLPEWWESGKHDKDLLVGAAKHGVSRTDYHILNDPKLFFLEAHKNFAQSKGASQRTSTPFQNQPIACASQMSSVGVAPATPVQEEKSSEQADYDNSKTENERKSPVPIAQDEQVAEPSKEDGETNCAENAQIDSDCQDTSELLSVKVEHDANDTSAMGTKMLADSEEKEFRPKLLFEKGSEDDDEDDDDDDDDIDKSEESSQPEACTISQGKHFDEESNASLSTARDETRDGFFMEDSEPTVAQLLHERTYCFSFWPKDRVMINRLDNICETVIQGKWPINRRQPFDFHGIINYTPTSVESPLPRRSFTELSIVGQGSFSACEDVAGSPQVSRDDAMNLSVPRQRRRRRKKIEIEAERAARRRNLMEMVAQLRESQAASDSGQERAVDLSKASREARSSTSVSNSSANPKYVLPNASVPVSDAYKPHVEMLQAGLSRTPTGLMINGSLVDGEMPIKRRRGRRKNVEGLDLLFMNNKRTSLNAKSGEVLLSPFQKPKQKRHRCRNPNKLDVNTLTGDERVPVVNKRNGKKMGGAMAPPMKDLPRWLEENPEFAVAPDWADVVKQSGFLPESMFDRVLTGPVVREEGASRRGRRPKSEIAKAAVAAAASASGINPLLMNSLFAGMDLASLQNLQNLQSLQLAGLMGFPSGLAAATTGDAKNPASLLPLMLPGMAGLPNMFGLGSLLSNPLTATASTSAASGASETESGISSKTENDKENDKENEDKEINSAESAVDSNGASSSSFTAAATAGLSNNPLAFNPFLLSTMAPGLFYPSMFLPPGLGMTLSGYPHTALAGLQSTVSSSDDKEDKTDGKTEDSSFIEGEANSGDSDLAGSPSKPSSLGEDELAQATGLDSIEGEDEEDED